MHYIPAVPYAEAPSRQFAHPPTATLFRIRPHPVGRCWQAYLPTPKGVVVLHGVRLA